MITTKREREYFITEGTTSDLQYKSGTNKGKNKILKNGGIPDEDIFSQLLNSITFIKQPDNTAFQDQAGLARKANDDCVINRDDSMVDTDEQITGISTKNYNSANNYYTTFVLPHQIPEIDLDDNEAPDNYTDTKSGDIIYANGLGIQKYERVETGSGNTRQVYKLLNSPSDNLNALQTYLIPEVELESTSTPEGYTDSESPIDTLTSDGLEINVYTRENDNTEAIHLVYKLSVDLTSLLTVLGISEITAGTFTTADDKTVTYNKYGFITNVESTPA